jgi:hypothetical protein
MRLKHFRPIVFAVVRLPRSPGPGFDVHGLYTVVGFGQLGPPLAPGSRGRAP